MEREQTPDLYGREEQCIKAIKTVRRAVFMRILVAALMVWAVILQPRQIAVWGLMVFVLVIDILGALPLIAEWRRQRTLLHDLIEQEEA